MTEENIEKLVNYPPPIEVGVFLNFIINRLNQFLEYDRKAISKLFSIRVPCNDTLVDAPHFQAKCYGIDCLKTKQCSIGVLGLLNGLIDDGNDGMIFVSYNDDGTIDKFFSKKH